MGVAPGARLVVLCIDDTDERTSSHSYAHALEALRYAAEQKLKIVNMSSTMAGNDTTMAGVVQQLGANGGLLINAAGNDGKDSPADAFLVTAANRNVWLFVGALNTTGTGYTMASYSNKAGAMADRYVVAMGDNITVQKDGSVALFSGTSSAAPQVSGLAALILSKWPQLSGQQAGDIILNTAKDLGDPGVDAIYGHGLVDAYAALSPVSPTLSNGAVATSLASSAMVVPASVSGNPDRNGAFQRHGARCLWPEFPGLGRQSRPVARAIAPSISPGAGRSGAMPPWVSPAPSPIARR